MSNTQQALRSILPETIRKAIDRHGLVPDGVNVVAGVSGGADSVALLHVLHRLGIPCTVAHLNHRLRGEASDADERFVRGLAEELGLPIAVRNADVRTLAEDDGLSIEMAARQARHDFFAQFEDSVIALGHHADDQVETFILKLARGAGPEGLGGMPYLQEIGPMRLIRPMLNLRRRSILEWLEANNLPWREDASNSDETFLRNRVRHTVLPLLEKELNPDLRETILRTMDILRAESAFVDEASGVVMPNGTEPEASSMLQHPEALQRRALRKWLFGQGVEDVGFEAIETILERMRAGKGTAVFELNHRQRVVVEYGNPRLETTAAPPDEPAWKLTVEEGAGWRRDHGRGAGILPAEASFDADKVGDASIEVRGWRPGDRIAPLGMEGTRKLQDIFTDQKIPRAQRPQIPVVVCRGEIIWLPGYRTARGWQVRSDNGPAVHARVEQEALKTPSDS